MDIRHTRRFNTINQASVLPHFSLMILSRIDLILPIQSEEERSIYLIQSSSSLPTCAASLAHILLYTFRLQYYYSAAYSFIRLGSSSRARALTLKIPFSGLLAIGISRTV